MCKALKVERGVIIHQGNFCVDYSQRCWKTLAQDRPGSFTVSGRVLGLIFS